MSERKQGVIRSWNESRCFDVIRVGPPSSLERYFLHVSQIRSGTAIPSVAAVVRFEINDSKPPEEYKLPQAIRADIEMEVLPPPPAVTAGQR